MAGAFVSGRFDDPLGGRLGRFRHRFAVGTDERNKQGTFPLQSIASTKLILYHMWCGGCHTSLCAIPLHTLIHNHR
jgi:hypothetical protein